VTVSCVLKRRDETQEYPLIVYNALTFIAFSTEETGPSILGRMQKNGLISPKLEWTVRAEQADATRV
jgi:hypothetical protein